MPAALFNATNNPNTADRIMCFNGVGYDTYWLFLNGGNRKWVKIGDSTLASANSRVVGANEGLFLNPKTALVTVPLLGEVREIPFACPLQVGTNLIGAGWPMPQSPNSRGMTVANGFTGSSSAQNADRILTWKGDATPGTTGYIGRFLLNVSTFKYWTTEGDSSLGNVSDQPLFDANSSRMRS